MRYGNVTKQYTFLALMPHLYFQPHPKSSRPFLLITMSVAPPPTTSLSESAKAFLSILDNSSEEELSLQLQDRMQFSKEAAACMVCVFDRLHSRIDGLCTQIQSAGNCSDSLVTRDNSFFHFVVVEAFGF